MKVKFRRSNIDDIDYIYSLNQMCFTTNDQWYKTIIGNYINDGIVIQYDNTIIGVLLQGSITPCNRPLFENDKYDKADKFIPNSNLGKTFLDNKLHEDELYGIVMICIHPDFRNKGLAKKLIQKHFDDNKTKLICLHTRESNYNAIKLYISMGYTHIANIKNKYFLPDEDSVFFIKQL